MISLTELSNRNSAQLSPESAIQLYSTYFDAMVSHNQPAVCAADVDRDCDGEVDSSEEMYMADVVASLRDYGIDAYEELAAAWSWVERVLPQDVSRLPGGSQTLVEHCAALRSAVRSNQALFTAVLRGNVSMMRTILSEGIVDALRDRNASPRNRDKARSTLRQCARDWTVDGIEERNAAYGPIIRTLLREFPDARTRAGVRVLTPGAGLGRLTWEIAQAGFISQGNEFSFHMLLVSQFILNSMPDHSLFTIYPHVLSTGNVVHRSDTLRAVQIPDVPPYSLPAVADLSMVAGDFLEVYGDQIAEWDAIAACFFLDTAHNIFDYLQCIAKCLKPGGIFMSFGPLLYHYSAERVNGDLSVELTFDDILSILPTYDFEIMACFGDRNTKLGFRANMLMTLFQ